jgi:hypothetical protein
MLCPLLILILNGNAVRKLDGFVLALQKKKTRIRDSEISRPVVVASYDMFNQTKVSIDRL